VELPAQFARGHLLGRNTALRDFRERPRHRLIGRAMMETNNDKARPVTQPLFGNILDFREDDHYNTEDIASCSFCGTPKAQTEKGEVYVYEARTCDQRHFPTCDNVNNKCVYFCSWHCCKKYFFRLYQICRLKGIKFDIEDIPF
jgi:hypothetical protein